MGYSDLSEYTIAADARGARMSDQLPDIGLTAHGYVLDLMGAEGWEVYYMPNTKGAYGHPDPRAYETIYFKRSAQ